jgi:flagella basal body P-ring formation protein FlgA
VATGKYRRFKGLLIPKHTNMNRMESRLTILQGMTPLRSMIGRTPDVRRGHIIKLNLKSGGMMLSTMGTVQDPGYIGDQIKVMSQKSKRILSGVLQKDGSLLVVL